MLDSEKFFAAVLDDFDHNGVAVIRRLREENPLEYLKLIVFLVVQDIRVSLGISEAGQHGKR